MGFFFIFLYDFVGQFLTTVHPNIGVKLSTHQSSFGRRVSRVVSGEGGYSLGCSFNVIPQAPVKAQISQRSLKISSKASAS
jgi:hypothetical protein